LRHGELFVVPPYIDSRCCLRRVSSYGLWKGIDNLLGKAGSEVRLNGKTLGGCQRVSAGVNRC